MPLELGHSGGETNKRHFTTTSFGQEHNCYRNKSHNGLHTDQWESQWGDV